MTHRQALVGQLAVEQRHDIDRTLTLLRDNSVRRVAMEHAHTSSEKVSRDATTLRILLDLPHIAENPEVQALLVPRTERRE